MCEEGERERAEIDSPFAMTETSQWLYLYILEEMQSELSARSRGLVHMNEIHIQKYSIVVVIEVIRSFKNYNNLNYKKKFLLGEHVLSIDSSKIFWQVAMISGLLATRNDEEGT